MRRLLFLCMMCVLLPRAGFAQTGVAPAVYVAHQAFYEAGKPDELNYKGEVLKLVLEKSKAKYGAYVLRKGPQEQWSQNRSYDQLDNGGIDVLASMTSVEREKTSIAVRYCLYKGLLGVRIGMGTRATVEALDGITTREELQRVQLGLVFDWPDYAIQTAAGLKVTRLTDIESSVRRLKMESFQLLPLGVVEVGPIAKRHELATISRWAIAYPSAYYLFVSRKHPELAERLSYGFEQAIKDGSFDQLFARHIGPRISQLGLERRLLFRFPNPQLPQDTPLHRRELWHPLMTSTRQ